MWSKNLYSSNVASIVIDNDNTVWFSHLSEIGCDNISYFKDGIWRIGPAGMYHLCAVDDNNVLWGIGYRLYAYDGNEIVEHIIKVPIPGFDCETTSPGNIKDIFIDDNDVIWIASSGFGDCTTSGIFTYDGEKVVPKLLGDFSNIAVDSKNNKWCSGGWDGFIQI